MDSGVEVTFSLKNVTAREVMNFSKSLKENPEGSIELFAGLLAKTVMAAPIGGDLRDPETYMNLPFWVDPDSEGVSFNEMVQGLNEVLEKVQSGTNKR